MSGNNYLRLASVEANNQIAFRIALNAMTDFLNQPLDLVG